jgi:hypothetical protein
MAREPEPLPTEDEIKELEREPYLQHCVEQKMPVGND